MSRFMPKAGEYTPKEKIFRALALVGVFALVIWAFWEHTGRTLRQIKDSQAISDTTGSLDKKQLAFVRGFARSLEAEFGLEFRLQVRDEPVEDPELNGKTVFFGIDPAAKQVVVRFPPLLSNALGKDFLEQLQNNHLSTLFDEGNDWREGITFALAAIWERLSEMQGRSNG